MKFYIAEVQEKNGSMEYAAWILFKTESDPCRQHNSIVANWRGENLQPTDEGDAYWCDATLISCGALREVPKKDYVVLKKYLTELQ